MKALLRNFLINLGALWATTQFLPALEITGGLKGLVIGSAGFMLANILLVPLMKILLLPLNLLTLGLFAWLSNVLALYFMVAMIPTFKILPFTFPGASLNGFIVPQMDLAQFEVAMVASFMIGAIIHVVHWLIK